MKPLVDILVVGDSGGSPYEFIEREWPVSLRVIPTGFGSMTAFVKSADLAHLIEGETELAGIMAIPPSTLPAVDPQAMFQAVALACRSLGVEGEHAASLGVDQINPDSLVDPTCSFLMTPGIRFLLGPRAECRAALFRRSSFKSIGPLRSVSEPIWDWAIRAARAGQRISSFASCDGHQSSPSRLPLLAPSRPGPEMNWLREHLAEFSWTESTVGCDLPSNVDQIALRAGLFQWHDFLDESHQLSQSIEGQGENRLGDYWHAIMHRREPDYSNAKYWFRQIGKPPSYLELRWQAEAILANSRAADAPRWRDRLHSGPSWNPLAFVDLCEECAANESSDLAWAARRIQFAEMSLLV